MPKPSKPRDKNPWDLLRELIVAQLAEGLTQRGFAPPKKLSTREYRFTRALDGGSWSLHFDLMRYTNQIDVMIHAIAIIDSVATLVREPKDKHYYTFSIDIAHLTRGSINSWTIFNDGDVEAHVAEHVASMLETYDEHIRPKLERYSDAMTLFDCLARNSELASMLAPHEANRAAHAVALALLTGHADQCARIAAEYDQYLASRTGQLTVPMQEHFARFKARFFAAHPEVSGPDT